MFQNATEVQNKLSFKRENFHTTKIGITYHLTAHLKYFLYFNIQVEVMIVSLFCTPENGILIQDSFPLSEDYNCLLGIEVPYHYFVRKVTVIFKLNEIVTAK